jgi:hypothetical protein
MPEVRASETISGSGVQHVDIAVVGVPGAGAAVQLDGELALWVFTAQFAQQRIAQQLACSFLTAIFLTGCDGFHL